MMAEMHNRHQDVYRHTKTKLGTYEATGYINLAQPSKIGNSSHLYL